MKNDSCVLVAPLCRPALEGGRPAHSASNRQPLGYFSGPIETRWEADGRTMTLLNELRYTDPKGVVWIAPAGSKVDGASIPRALWSFFGGPFEGKYRNASVLHDVAYDQKTRPWQQVDRMFYDAMRCSGVGAVEAKTLYFALYRHGRHWRSAKRRENEPRTTAVNPAEVDAIDNGSGKPIPPWTRSIRTRRRGSRWSPLLATACYCLRRHRFFCYRGSAGIAPFRYRKPRRKQNSAAPSKATPRSTLHTTTAPPRISSGETTVGGCHQRFTSACRGQDQTARRLRSPPATVRCADRPDE